MMKRYDMDFSCECGRFGDDGEREEPDGEWVKYSDAVEAVYAERGACIKACKDVATYFKYEVLAFPAWQIAHECMEAIRARGENIK